MTATHQGPTSIKAVLLDGMDLFEEGLDQLSAEDWSKPTPCADWTVEELVRHVGDTADRASAFLRGETWQATASTAAADQRYAEAAKELRGVLAETTLDERWPLPSDSPNAKLMFHGCDFAVHRWDLAVARGEEEELPADWVALMDGFFRATPAEVLRRPRAFHDPVEPQPSDGPTRRLMAYLGRSPLT
jgi:uncharacterized protein (TIGR03086 family)